MADLPEISQNLDDPLPQVDPNSDLVPYRMSRTDPGQSPVVTTGYGPRGRPPIQPPQGFGGGVGMPDLDQVYQAAFSKLPVDEAAKAVESATRYVAQRAYQKDIQAGADPLRTFAKYAPSMFKQATGLPEVFQAQIQQQRLTAPPTPQQMIQNRLNQAKFDAAQAAAKAKADDAKARQALAARKLHVLSTGEVLQETGNPDDPVKVIRSPTPKPDESVTETYKIPAVEGQEAQPESKGFLGFGAHPATPAVEAQPERTIRTTKKVQPGKALTKDIATQFLKQAKGDKEKARKLARDAGYQF